MTLAMIMKLLVDLDLHHFSGNGYQVSDRDISSLNLYYDGIIPKVSIMFIDSMGFMKKDGFPLDDAKLNFLNSGTKNLKSIHLKFKLENFQENKLKLIQ
jgi:hypothetical protein